MTYEPRGKMKTLLDAMRASNMPVWTSVDVARVLETTTAAVPAFVEPSIRHGVLHRKLENGRSKFSLKPFAPIATVAPVAPRETTATGWKPPQMACTRPTAGTTAGQQVVQERPEPAGDAGATPATPPAAADLPTCAIAQTDPKCVTAPPPEAAPALADASIPLQATATGEEEGRDAEPVTWSIWDDGDLDLFGLVELEGGGHRLPAEAVRRLRNFIAWMPA